MQVLHNATSPRVVLIVDMWHPQLSDAQRLEVLGSNKVVDPVKTADSLPTYLEIRKQFQQRQLWKTSEEL